MPRLCSWCGGGQHGKHQWAPWCCHGLALLCRVRGLQSGHPTSWQDPPKPTDRTMATYRGVRRGASWCVVPALPLVPSSNNSLLVLDVVTGRPHT